MSNEEDLRIRNAKKLLLTIIEIRKRQPKNLVYLMKKEGFKNLTHSGHIKVKRSREKATRGPLDKFEQIG